jgi:flagellum-specific peptidoglycan hydrolase FlgJ
MKKIVFLLLLITTKSLYAPSSWIEFNIIEHKISVIKKSEFSKERLIQYMELTGVENAGIVISQSILETGWFKSRIFKSNNNLFGMKHPRVRPSVSMGSQNGHALYSHWTDSVDDYLLWYQYVTRNGKPDCYKLFLKKIGYAEDPLYVSKLESIQNKYLQDDKKNSESIISQQRI